MTSTLYDSRKIWTVWTWILHTDQEKTGPNVRINAPGMLVRFSQPIYLTNANFISVETNRYMHVQVVITSRLATLSLPSSCNLRPSVKGRALRRPRAKKTSLHNNKLSTTKWKMEWSTQLSLQWSKAQILTQANLIIIIQSLQVAGFKLRRK